MDESTGIKRRAGPEVADVGTGKRLDYLQRWDGVRSCSAPCEGSFEDITVCRENKPRRTRCGGQGSAAGG